MKKQGRAEGAVTENESEKQGRLYRMLWRWHFYAGLVCIPFVMILALSGSVYLFRPQIEAWIDRDFARLERTGAPATQAAVVDAALAQVPGSALAAIVLRDQPDQAARVIVSEHGVRTRVYVHPDTLEVLKTVPEEGRFERTVAHIHGELLMGNAGSILVELAASWAIVMVLTGLYLWWPRQAQGLGGVLYPRIGQGAKRFWRDLHAVTGVWVSALALFLLTTGLPWASVWGNGLKQVRNWTGTAAITQDWVISSADEHAGHMHHDAMIAAPSAGALAIDQIVSRAEELKLAPPVLLTPPTKDAAIWWVKSNAQNRPQRQDVGLSAMTGEIVASSDFSGKHIIDKIIGVGIAAHEGQLFGPLNQALGVITALGLITLCVTAFVMWRRRAPQGALGAPPPIPDPRIGFGLAVLIVIAAIMLPVLGASLLLLAAVERGVLVHWPRARQWLGLSGAC